MQKDRPSTYSFVRRLSAVRHPVAIAGTIALSVMVVIIVIAGARGRSGNFEASASAQAASPQTLHAVISGENAEVRDIFAPDLSTAGLPEPVIPERRRAVEPAVSFDRAYVDDATNVLVKAERSPNDALADNIEPRRAQQGERGGEDRDRPGARTIDPNNVKPHSLGRPEEQKLTRAGHFDGDLTKLPYEKPIQRERPEREQPRVAPGVQMPPDGAQPPSAELPDTSFAPSVAAPAPLSTFDGLDNATWGAGHPPDPNGDVGRTYYIQSINSSVGIYDKSSGSRVAAFTLDTFMSQGSFGNICDTDNFGDPVVLYDTFEDRWVVTDFAFQLDASGNVSPQVALQCFAVSKTGDPVNGGWNYYWANTTGGLGDYPKLGVWTDGLYMSVNMFDYSATGSFQNARVYAFNKAQMYAGAPTVQSVWFNLPTDQFTVIPANARLQTGTPPAGSPNYFASVWNYLNSEQIWKFKVDWNLPATSAVTGPFDSTMAFWWAQYSQAAGTAPTPKNANDTLYPRLMMQNQYTNIGGVESIWTSHTVGGGTTPNPTTSVSTSTQSSVRYYQLNVTGGTIAANTTQSFTYNPDTTMYRYMPSAAVDRLGDMAIGYTTSNSTNNPAIKYAGRLAGDAANSISLTEQTLFAGTGAQTGNCGGATCTRWGDYSAMSLDPDGCTFWYTNMYYSTNDLNHRTRIGSFKLNSACTALGSGGTVSGTVTVSPGGSPISGATVALGSRTATTDASGNYSFTGIPAGTYPTITASYSGYGSASQTAVVVTDGNTTTKNFGLTASSTNGCPTDTSQTDFQAGALSNVDITTTPGAVTLSNVPAIDQQNTSSSGSGFGFTNTTWYAQTFTAAATGQLTKVDVNFFSLSCSAVTMPSVTVSVRNAAGNVPTGADLSSATVSGFCNGGGGYYTFTLASPVNVTAGTQYAIVWRAASAIPSGAGYYGLVSSSNPYSGGRRASSSNSGSSWSGATGTSNNDFVFRTYVKTGYSASGDITSGAKDANPGPGANPTWSTLSWTATQPVNTAVKFQVAASNNSAGVFNFVGPDGTSGTYFTISGSSLSQFNGFRFLKYKSYLTSSNSANTPTLSDVTICFVDQAPTALSAASASGTFGGTVNLSATLTSNGSAVSGKTVDFKLNNVSVGSGVTNASGVASLANASLVGIAIGSYPSGVSATFAGDGSYLSSSSTNSLNVAAPLYGIAGTVVYGGTPSGGTTKYVPGVTMTASGASSGSVLTDAAGTYSLGSLSGGNNTVTPTRSGDLNSINSTDALRIQQYLVGSVSFTAAQLAAADTSNNGTVNSTDALRIQQWIVGTAVTNVVGQWRFLPSSRNYSSLASNLSGENYTGILMGEVSGNWVPPGPLAWTSMTDNEELLPVAARRPEVLEQPRTAESGVPASPSVANVTVSLPANATAGNGTTVLIPITVSQLPAVNDANAVYTYNFNVQYNAAILSSPTVVTAGSISAATGGTAVGGSPQTGVFGVSYTNPNGITGSGTLIYIQFNVIGTTNQQTALTFVGTTTSPAPFEFNEGDPTDTDNNGQFTVSGPTGADVSVAGRVITANGQGVMNARITVQGTESGGQFETLTGPFGYFYVPGLNAGETYVVTVSSKRFTFPMPSKVLTLNQNADDVIFTANP